MHPDTIGLLTDLERAELERARRRRLALISVGITVLVLGSAALLLRLTAKRPPAPLQGPEDAAVLADATKTDGPSTMYYPTRLPPGFEIDSNVGEPSPGVHVYKILTDKKQPIYVHQQKLPEMTFFDVLYDRYTYKDLVDVALGTAVVGHIPEETLLASIILDADWIMVTTHASVPQDKFEAVIKELRPKEEIPRVPEGLTDTPAPPPPAPATPLADTPDQLPTEAPVEEGLIPAFPAQ